MAWSWWILPAASGHDIISPHKSCRRDAPTRTPPVTRGSMKSVPHPRNAGDLQDWWSPKRAGPPPAISPQAFGPSKLFETFETKALDANGHHLAGRNGTFSGAKCGFTMGFTTESMENGGQGRESPPNFFQPRVTQVTWKWSASSQEHPKDQGAYFMLPPGRVSTSVNWILALNLSKLISGTFVREIFKFYPQKSSRHLKLIDWDLLAELSARWPT